MPAPRFVAAIDQGTTSTRCMLFEQRGRVAGVAQKEHRQIYPEPGWVEHDPLEIWQRTCEVVEQVLQEADVRPGEIAGIGITNQRETTLLWDKETGKPFYNAIVWQDTRTKELCDSLAAEGGIDRFRMKTGLPLATYFSGPKLRWILDHVPEARQAAVKGNALFGNIDTWLIWWLTGGPSGGRHVTDVTNASRTLLMNLETLEWDEECLSAMRIPPSVLPRIVSSSDPATWGETQPAGSFHQAIPVCGDLGDQQAALVGQVCFEPGEAKNTYGTGCFLLMNTGIAPVHSGSGLLTTVGYRFADQAPVYALEGSIAVTGALVQWFRDNLGLIRQSSDIEDLARTVEDNGGAYFVPAFSGLFAPYWRSDARGVLVGLTRYVNKGHIARAALEATAYQVREVIEAIGKDGVSLSGLKVDGGMVHNELLMQFQSDILNVPVVRPSVAETTSLGVAYAAGLAVGFWTGLDDLRRNWEVDRTWYPQLEAHTRERLYRAWLKAVTRSFDWVE